MKHTPAAMRAVGRRVKAARLRAGLSQRATAAGLDGVSYAYLSRVEAGSRMPSVRALRLIAGRLGVSPVWLETGRNVVELELPRVLLLELREFVQSRAMYGVVDEHAGATLELVDAIDEALAVAGPDDL